MGKESGCFGEVAHYQARSQAAGVFLQGIGEDHGVLLTWLQGQLKSFPGHSLPSVLIWAHLCSVS